VSDEVARLLRGRFALRFAGEADLKGKGPTATFALEARASPTA
jgi:hypothetical protein